MRAVRAAAATSSEAAFSLDTALVINLALQCATLPEQHDGRGEPLVLAADGDRPVLGQPHPALNTPAAVNCSASSLRRYLNSLQSPTALNFNILNITLLCCETKTK